MKLISDSARVQIKSLIRVLAVYAFYVLAMWAAFTFIFHFSNDQAVGLGLVISIAIDIAASRKRPEEASFAPHRMIFQFNVFPMLIDIGLIQTPDEYDAIAGEAPPIPSIWDHRHIYHRDVRAYVLATDPGVVHFPQLLSYSSQVQFEQKLTAITMSGRFGNWSPDVFIRPGRGGFHIGLRMKEGWWKGIKQNIAQGVVIEEDWEYNFGTVRLSVAILPYQVTHVYYVKTARNHQASVCKLAAQTGWSNESLGGAEIGYFGESYTHRYMTLWVQDID